MKASHRVIRNTGILYARMGVTVFLSLYTTRVTLSALGAGDFGIFNVVGGIIAMLSFLNASMAGATQRFMSYAQGEGSGERQRYIFNIGVILHLVIALAVVSILEAVGFILFDGVLKISIERMQAARIVYHFAVIGAFFTIISVPYDAVINARENMLLFAVLGVFESATKLAIALFIARTDGDKLVIYGFLMAVPSVLLLVIRASYCHARYAECILAPIRLFNGPLFKEMTAFAGWSFLYSSTSILANYGQGLVLNAFFGTVVNAAQGIATQVSGQLGAFSVTMLRALYPLIAKSEGAGDRKLMLQASVMGSKVGFFLLMVFYVPFLIEMPYIFKLWLKDAPDYAIIFCRLILVRNLIEQLFFTLNSSIAAVGAVKRHQIVSSILTPFPIIISILLFRGDFSSYFMHISFLFYSIIISAVTLYFASKTCGLSSSAYLKNVVFRCAAAFAICFTLSAIPIFFSNTGLLRLLIVIGISVVSFVISVWFVGFGAGERNSIRPFILAGVRRVNFQIRRLFSAVSM